MRPRFVDEGLVAASKKAERLIVGQFAVSVGRRQIELVRARPGYRGWWGDGTGRSQSQEPATLWFSIVM